MEQKTYTEDELVQMYQDGDISMLELISMHSEHWQEEFKDFCLRENREENEDSAEAFIEFLDTQMEKAMDEGDA